MNVIGFVKSHPYETGAGVFVVGFLLLMFLRGSGGSSQTTSSDGSLEAAYLQAQSAEAQSGNALQATQIEANASTAQAQINAGATVATNQLWSGAQVAEADDQIKITSLNDSTEQAIAPYAVQANLISTLGNVADQPGQVVTSSSSDSGFFGLGASSSTNSYVVPAPGSLAAGEALTGLAGSVMGNSGSALSTGMNASH